MLCKGLLRDFDKWFGQQTTCNNHVFLTCKFLYSIDCWVSTYRISHQSNFEGISISLFSTQTYQGYFNCH